jgi:hypothetical protein
MGRIAEIGDVRKRRDGRYKKVGKGKWKKLAEKEDEDEPKKPKRKVPEKLRRSREGASQAGIEAAGKWGPHRKKRQLESEIKSIEAEARAAKEKELAAERKPKSVRVTSSKEIGSMLAAEQKKLDEKRKARGGKTLGERMRTIAQKQEPSTKAVEKTTKPPRKRTAREIAALLDHKQGTLEAAIDRARGRGDNASATRLEERLREFEWQREFESHKALRQRKRKK